MSEQKTSRFWVCERDDGTFLAASTEAPRFCFAADTEDAVIAKANRAFEAYFGNEFRAVPKRQEVRARTQRTISQFRPLRVLDYHPKELAVG